MIRNALLVSAVMVASVALAPASDAGVFRYTGAGGACHPANGGSVPKFTRGPHHLTNNNTTDQYVVCHFAMDDATSSPNGLGKVELHIWSANAGATITCVGQTGAYYFGVVHARSTVSRTHTFTAPGESHYLEWDAVLQRESLADTLSISCKMGPGTRLGLIARAESEPAS